MEYSAGTTMIRLNGHMLNHISSIIRKACRLGTIVTLFLAPAPFALAQTSSSSFQDCAFCPKMVMLPTGEFVVGSTKAERVWAVSQGGQLSYFSDETPRHAVQITQPLAIGRFEVTRGQFAAFVAATNYTPGPCYKRQRDRTWAPQLNKNWRDPGFEQKDSHPAVCVSWADAHAYVSWLTELTGRPYRLPSEMEWEYAARAGTQAMRYWGDDRSNAQGCRFANLPDLTALERFPGNSQSYFACRDGYVFTAPVGGFEANSFGLYDTLGNVQEWTLNCYTENYAGAPDDSSAIAADDCQHRVTRGGSWGSHPRNLRAANRAKGAPGGGDIYTGFRVVVDTREVAWNNY